MEELSPSRDQLRAILADPESTEKQIIEAKLVLGRRIAGGANRCRQICEEYNLTPEQMQEMMSSHQRIMGRVEAKAIAEVHRLEHLLMGLNKESTA